MIKYFNHSHFKKYCLKLICFSSILIVNSCAKDDGPPPDIDPTTDASALSRSFIIDGENLKGEIPETNTSSSSVAIAFFQESASITNDNELFVPLGFNNTNIDGILLSVIGADNYWKIPLKQSKTSSKKHTASRKVDDNTFVLSIGVPDNILNGSFKLSYKLFNNAGEIGTAKELNVAIISPESLCADGATLGSEDGRDGISVRTYILGESPGWVSIYYNTFTIKDRLDVKYDGEWIRSTGRLIGTNAPPIKLCSEATPADGFVSGSNVFSFFYDPDEGKRVDVYVSGCLNGGTRWEYEILECPKDKITLGVHSNAAPGAGVTEGHAWVSLTKNGQTDFYGLWPDEHAAVTNNGTGTDIRTNIERGVGAYRRFYPLTENQYQQFQILTAQNKQWSLSYNCSSWAEEVVTLLTNENVDASELLGVETPRRMSTSIINLENASPTATQYIPPNVSEDKSSCSFCY